MASGRGLCWCSRRAEVVLSTRDCGWPSVASPGRFGRFRGVTGTQLGAMGCPRGLLWSPLGQNPPPALGTTPGVRRGRAVPLPPYPRVASPRLHVWKGTPRAWQGAWGRQSRRERGHRGRQPGLGEGRGRAGWAGSPVPVAGPSAAWCAARGGRAQLHRDENSKCGRVAREQLPWERAEEEFSHSEGASWGKIQEFSAAVEGRKAGRGDGERWGELAPVVAVRAGPDAIWALPGLQQPSTGVPVSPAQCWGWAARLFRWGWEPRAKPQEGTGRALPRPAVP